LALPCARRHLLLRQVEKFSRSAQRLVVTPFGEALFISIALVCRFLQYVGGYVPAIAVSSVFFCSGSTRFRSCTPDSSRLSCHYGPIPPHKNTNVFFFTKMSPRKGPCRQSYPPHFSFTFFSYFLKSATIPRRAPFFRWGVRLFHTRMPLVGLVPPARLVHTEPSSDYEQNADSSGC